jgi:hypothetical protein
MCPFHCLLLFFLAHLWLLCSDAAFLAQQYCYVWDLNVASDFFSFGCEKMFTKAVGT